MHELQSTRGTSQAKGGEKCYLSALGSRLADAAEHGVQLDNAPRAANPTSGLSAGGIGATLLADFKPEIGHGWGVLTLEALNAEAQARVPACRARVSKSQVGSRRSAQQM